jgi:nicotinate-nucleotide adenylyltransferase
MTPALQRLEMVRLAVANEPGLNADAREIDRKGLSYSIDTIIQLRAELGPQEALCFCIGMDSLTNIASWYRWREFLDYCHIVVAARPGCEMPLEGEVADWAARHRVEDKSALMQKPCGSLFVDEMTLLPVSATNLRSMLKSGESIRYLTPDSVIHYISKHCLYVQ